MKTADKEHPWGREWRELKPCEGCGHNRMVKVSAWKKGFYGSGAGAAEEEKPRWARFCQACDLLARAQRHEETAHEFRRRARAIIEKRSAQP
jgi:hypothetical protein